MVAITLPGDEDAIGKLLGELTEETNIFGGAK